MTTAFLTPFDRGTVRRVSGRRFVKQLLPIAEIQYNGRAIDFTRDKLRRVADSFRRKAYDMVPLLVDDGRRGHDVGPEGVRGKLVGLSLTDTGLDGVFDLTEAAAALVREHPQAGVSCRIVEDLSRSDGQKFTDVLEHVLLTLRPRVTGMSPWTAVADLAASVTHVVDLTDQTYRPVEQARGGLHPLVQEAQQRLAAGAEALETLHIELEGARAVNALVDARDARNLARAYLPGVPLKPDIPPMHVLTEDERLRAWARGNIPGVPLKRRP